MKKNIVLIGPTPPPIGGVSIHVKRFSLLLKELGIPCRTISTTSSESSDGVIAVGGNLVLGLLRSLPQVRGAIVVVHSSELYGTFVALLCKIFGGQVVQYFHNGRAIKRFEPRVLLGSLWGWALRRLDGVFVVNSDIRRDINVLSMTTSLVQKVNPYLPPHPSELRLGPLSESFCSSRIYIGWCGIATGDRAEIYGFGFFLDLLIALVSSRPNVVGVIGVGGRVVRDSLSDEVKAKFDSISSRLVFVPESVAFAAVMTKLHVFVRSTSSDGDAVSVREALSLGAHVLASNVVERPDGVVLYRFGDVDDGLSKLIGLVGKPRPVCDSKYSAESISFHQAEAPGSIDEVRSLIEFVQS